MIVLEVIGAAALLVVLALGLEWLATNITIKGK